MVASVTDSPRAGTMTLTVSPDPFAAVPDPLEEGPLEEGPPEEGPPLGGSSASVFLAFSLRGLVSSGPALPDSEILPSRASTPTVSPSAATISESTPATGEGTSTVTLSVSNSQSISSTSTVSPGFLNQVATVASVTLSPRVGTRISVLMGVISLQCSAPRRRGRLAVLCAGWRGRSPVRRWRCDRHRWGACAWP